MTKIAILGDSHFGVREHNKIVAGYFDKFYYEQFFPYLKEHDIKHVIQSGDLHDRRKYINFQSTNQMRKIFQKFHDENIDIHVYVGNHDSYYKNSLEINTIDQLYSHSIFNTDIEGKGRLYYYDKPQDIDIAGTSIAILPWICSDNYEKSINFINNTKSNILFGHLELSGFQMHKGTYAEHGMSASLFKKFEMVISGHYHTKSHNGNIFYVGTPYEINWADYNDPKGFHILDTETNVLTFIENKFKLHHKFEYDDSNSDLDTIMDIDVSDIEDCYVKIVAYNKKNPYWFDLFFDKIEKASPFDIKVMEDFSIEITDEELEDDIEDTLTILKNTAETIDMVGLDKKSLISVLSDLYQEAINLE